LILYSPEIGKVGLVLIDREGPSMSAVAEVHASRETPSMSAVAEVHAGRETPSLSAMAEVQGAQPGWDATTLAENVQVSVMSKVMGMLTILMEA
jgi:hypothetical protein